MKRTIREIEQAFGENFDDAIEEYYESCIRNGYYDINVHLPFVRKIALQNLNIQEFTHH